jgi:hypothetical protein
MFEFKGLTMSEMAQIHQHYEAACTAEYVMENYDIVSESEALAIGYNVRRLMDKYGYDEEEAIAIYMAREKGK